MDWNIYHDYVWICCRIPNQHARSCPFILPWFNSSLYRVSVPSKYCMNYFAPHKLRILFPRYDLLYEWLFEIRSKIFLSEYAIVWATFLAIQIVGMDAGIVIGVLVSIVDHVVHSAKTTGVNRVYKRSRAVWTPEQHKILQDHGYHLQSPKIVTLGMFSLVRQRCILLHLSLAKVNIAVSTSLQK